MAKRSQGSELSQLGATPSDGAHMAHLVNTTKGDEPEPKRQKTTDACMVGQQVAALLGAHHCPGAKDAPVVDAANASLGPPTTTSSVHAIIYAVELDGGNQRFVKPDAGEPPLVARNAASRIKLLIDAMKLASSLCCTVAQLHEYVGNGKFQVELEMRWADTNEPVQLEKTPYGVQKFWTLCLRLPSKHDHCVEAPNPARLHLNLQVNKQANQFAGVLSRMPKLEKSMRMKNREGHHFIDKEAKKILNVPATEYFIVSLQANPFTTKNGRRVVFAVIIKHEQDEKVTIVECVSPPIEIKSCKRRADAGGKPRKSPGHAAEGVQSLDSALMEMKQDLRERGKLAEDLC